MCQRHSNTNEKDNIAVSRDELNKKIKVNVGESFELNLFNVVHGVV